MSKGSHILHNLYCRLSCYTSVTYKNIINTCVCHPQCKVLNTYKNVKTYQNPNIKYKDSYHMAFMVGENAKVCACIKKCKFTKTDLS